MHSLKMARLLPTILTVGCGATVALLLQANDLHAKDPQVKDPQVKELTSGLQVGAALGPFETVKCAGGMDDGIEVGEHVCYRSRYSSQPLVIIFTHQLDQVAELAKAIDGRIEKSQGLRAFISVLGSDLEATKKLATEWGAKMALKHVAIVVPLESQHGPEHYQLHADSTTTVVLARRSRVIANHAVDKSSDGRGLLELIVPELDKL